MLPFYPTIFLQILLECSLIKFPQTIEFSSSIFSMTCPLTFTLNSTYPVAIICYSSVLCILVIVLYNGLL